MEGQAATPKQYQHYIPRFLLNNFSHPFQPGGKSEATPPVSQHGPSRHKGTKKIRRGEPVVNRVDMSSETAVITETPVRSVLGDFNMYQNAGISSREQNRIEQKLSRLESDASAIFRRILAAFTANHDGLWLTREERNLMRKFLFVMKYRSSAIFERFRHETMATYVGDDKEQLKTYMQQRGFSRPIDVWLDNLDKFIDVQMDAEMRWAQELPRRTYPLDAYWVIMHCQASYMTICTPSSSDAEFFVSDNIYNIVEGPHQVFMDTETGKLKCNLWSSLHEFAPVSPRLLIVLRSYLFPCPEEDAADARVKFFREMSKSIHESQFGPLSESLLADLPVSKARNNYSEIVDGVLRPVQGRTGPTHHDRHSFFFSFFPLDNTHVERINGVFLDNASSCTSLVFCSEAAFRDSLARYMADGKCFPKKIGFTHPATRICLAKFSALLGRRGMETRPPGDSISLMREALRYVLDGNHAAPFMKVYQILGGSKETLPKDMDQSIRMFRLRVKIDAWSHGVDERVRQNNRNALVEHFLTMPRRRVWLYLKRWRLMSLQLDGSDLRTHLEMSTVDKPEDVIARAWQVIKPDRLNHLMYWAAGNYIMKTRPPGFDPWARITLDSRGAQQLAMLKEFVFSSIFKIEHFAAYYHTGARLAATQGPLPSPLLTLDQLSEMVTRMAVQANFKSLLKRDLEDKALDALAGVFFELLYPLIPGGSLAGS
ncbi:hypothetical protein E4U21_002434 [Claviceps maximensis]|nr:hypothetical protein E4U21_002434 [Claviceps maximensis]